MAEPRQLVTTVGQATTALLPYTPITLDIACAQLGLRSLRELEPATFLADDESDRIGRLLTLLDAATDGTGEGYVGVLWTMGPCAALGGSTPMEACRSEAHGSDAMAELKRQQDRLFES
ncbi:MAG TPA: hypothetical protein VKB31_07915 [Trueperaceae bacterium]|nr:hypothetical protein [Trueperaceae bacterium]